ncbi:right-handed parallel beta-helix repeat-containing protein [Microbacterium sp. ZW T6_19]|uniref:right-handed parallel beta-helix repeat-containing protein n=1 Tax=Microbacterium sp. ZW T6_19 TaxID=3378082 RepID=UPI00385381A7
MNIATPSKRSTRRITQLSTAIAAAFALTLLGAMAPIASAAADTGLLAQDQFDRSTDGGWGSAAVGGVWSSNNSTVLEAAEGTGVFRLKPSTFAVNTLAGGIDLDSSVTFTFWPSELPESGNGATTSAILRAADGHSYQARARITASERVSMTISRYDGSVAKEVVLVSDTVLLRNTAAEDRYTIEFAATGDSAVALAARVWRVGTTAPDWQLSYTDRSVQRISHAGAIGVGAYLSSGTPALDLMVDDFSARHATMPEPTPTPTPTPTQPEEPVPTEPTEPETPTAPPAMTGSAAVGSTAYAVPSGAVYVRAGGASSGSGTPQSPYGSLAYAVAKAPSGATLVLRGGTYHETVTIPIGKKLTIQSYPGEAVWLDGRSKVTGWQQSGSAWAVSGWSYDFDRRVSFSKSSDETSRWTDATNPYAGYPDQVWVDGVAQRQVGSATQLTSGTFFVDTAQKKLVLGSDPTGKTVQASTLQKALTIAGSGSTVRGLGVRGYATTVNQMGAITVEVPKITLENLVITQNATIGLYAWAADHQFRNLTVTQNGLMGIGANKADRLSIKNSQVDGNNVERFKPAPVSGGMKITASSDVVIQDSTFSDNVSSGLWFDMSAYNATIVGNTISGNGRYGLLYEASEKALIADNTFANAGHTALMIYNAGGVQIWNNTFASNARSFWFMQDERRQTDAALASKIPWVVKNITVKNNVVSFGTGACPILTQDTTRRWYGNEFKITMDSNLYHRASATAPGNFACWANGPAGTRSFKTLAEFQAHTGGDQKSRLLEGTSPLTPSYALTSAAASLVSGIVTPLPSNIATRIGATSGLLLGQIID